jgi:hypothetical protein
LTNAVYDGSPKNVSITTDPAGLPVIVTYNGSTNAPLNTGSYSLAASITHPNYSGSGTGSMIISQASNTITFPQPILTNIINAKVMLAGNASSGLPVSYSTTATNISISGSTVTILGTGTASIMASQQGNGNFVTALPVIRTISLPVLISASTVRISGSSEFRRTANGVMYSLFGMNLMATDRSSTNDVEALNLLFTNCMVNGTNVNISVAWANSETGIRSAASGTNTIGLPFLDPVIVATNSTTFPALTKVGGDMVTLSNSVNTSFSKADITFSDILFGGSLVSRPVSLTARQVAVVPYMFVAGKSFPETNMTTSILGDLVSAGNTTLNQFSGNIAQTNVKVFMMGRNPDTGARITAQLIGKVGANASLSQWKPLVTNGSIVNLSKTPMIPNFNGVTVVLGNSGEALGSALCSTLTNPVAVGLTVSGAVRGTGGNHLVSYAAASDAINYYASGLVPLRYNNVEGRHYTTNGVNPSATNLDRGYSNIISGRYPFWSYESWMYDPSATNLGVITNLGMTLEGNITNRASTDPILAPNISLGEMKVRRSSDGGAITPK